MFCFKNRVLPWLPIDFMKKLEKALKSFVLWIIRLISPAESSGLTIPDYHEFKRILIFRLDNRLGNALLILPLIQSVRHSLPGAGIDVLMSASFCEIYDKHPDISAIIPYNQKSLLKNPLRFLQFFRRLKKNNYDLVISSTNPDTISTSQAVFSRLITSRYNVGFLRKNSDQIYTHTVKGDNTIAYGLSQIALWRKFDPQAIDCEAKVYFADHLPQSYSNTVLFWLGATKNKILPIQLVSETLKLLDQSGIKYSLAAGPGDKALLDMYPPEIAGKIMFRSGTLKETAHFFSGFRVLILPDTGPMHLAVAMGLPVIQLFNNSNSRQYGYSSDRAIIMENSLDEQRFMAFIEAFG